MTGFQNQHGAEEVDETLRAMITGLGAATPLNKRLRGRSWRPDGNEISVGLKPERPPTMLETE
jgi:hypothetical protein